MSRPRTPDSPIQIIRPGTGRRGATPKTGPNKSYTEAELVLFAAYREQRQGYAPRQCDGGNANGRCWVEHGPPAMSTNPTHCIGCGGLPRSWLMR